MLGSLGFAELLFIFGLALLVFGPKRLPEVGRALGRGMAELRKASNDLKRTINAEMIEQEIRDNDPRRIVRDSLRDVKKSLTDLDAPPPASSSASASSTPSSSTGPAPPAETDPAPSGPAETSPSESATDSDPAASAAPEGSVARGSTSSEDSAETSPETDSGASDPS